jgi:predicted DNA-binding transcriptional regulator AlpA
MCKSKEKQDNLSRCVTYDIKELSQILGVSKITIQREMRKPDFIPSFNIASSVKFVREDVWEWIGRRKEKAKRRYCGL